MSENNTPRHKERIDIGPDLGPASGSGSDMGRNRTNIGNKSNKKPRKGQKSWMPQE